MMVRYLLYLLSLLLLLSISGCGNPQQQQYNRALELLAYRDYIAALPTLVTLANSGHAAAQFRLGLMHLHGFGMQKNAREAARWLKKAAQQGDIGGQYSLSRLYLNGIGVSKNETLGLQWLEKLAERGFIPAQYQTALLYLNGKGTAVDNSRGIMWLERAALKKHKKAAALLTRAYRQGLLDLPKDSQQADYWQQQMQHSFF